MPITKRQVGYTYTSNYGNGLYLTVLDSRDISLTNPAEGPFFEHNKGLKQYELSNHLGNVLVVIEDKKVSHEGSTGVVGHYTASMLNVQDYFPFGWTMPGKKYSNSNLYRQGFNGKENDTEYGAGGLTQDYGFRMYNPASGKFLSVDPLFSDYPWNSTFAFSENNPIKFIDLDGLEKYDPCAEPPTGVTIIELAAIPGGIIGDRGIKAGTYTLLGVSNTDGKDYWIARQYYSDNTYRDVFIVGTDAVSTFFKNSDYYENIDNNFRLFTQVLGGNQRGDIIEGWVDVVTNPLNWVAGAHIGVSGAARPKPNYGAIPEPKNVKVGGNFTVAQKKAILEANRKANGGVLRSDMSGKVLDPPVQSKKGVPANMNQAEVDHIKSLVYETSRVAKNVWCF